MATALSAAIVIGFVTASSPAAGLAAAQSCARDLVTEDGTCARRIPAPALSAADRRTLANLDAEIARLRHQHGGARATSASAYTPYPYTSVLPEVERMRILKEGEGNGGAWWTCGPSATRNAVAALFKRHTGSYRYLSEAQIAGWEGTTRHGTARANVATTLNRQVRRLHDFGVWQTVSPRDAIDYLDNVVIDTGLRKRAIIANVDSEYLDNFKKAGSRGLDHFDIVYGSKTTRALKTYVRLAEEYDPRRHFGRYVTDPPYGKYWIPLAHAFAAVNHTPIHGIVR